MPRRTFVLAAAAAAAHLFARAETGTLTLLPFNWTLDSAAPMLQYAGAGRWSLPSEDGTASFVEGSTVSLSFVGSALFVYGTADPGSEIRLTVDGASNTFPEPSDALLAKAQAEFGHHNATLTLVHGGVSLHNLTITTGMHAAANSSRPRTQPFISENNRNSFYQLDGPWSTPADAHLIAAPGAKFSAAVPANSSYLVLRGSSLNESSYTVSLNPEPYGMKTVTLATRPATEPGLLYMAPLDPSVEYSFDFAADPNGTDISLHDMTFYTSLPCVKNPSLPANASDDPGTTPSNTTDSTPESSSSSVSTETPSPSATSSLNLAAIIGGAVGGGVALILLVLLIFCCCRSRPAPKEDNDAESVKPYIEFPAGLSFRASSAPTPLTADSRSQSILGLGSIFESITGSSSHKRGSVMEGNVPPPNPQFVFPRRDGDSEILVDTGKR